MHHQLPQKERSRCPLCMPHLKTRQPYRRNNLCRRHGSHPFQDGRGPRYHGHFFSYAGRDHQLGEASTCVRRGPKTQQVFFHLISFKWNKAGVWSYDNNKDNEEFRARTPMVDGSFGDIEHLGVETPIKTLGSMTCPTGCNKGSIKYMLDKANAWKDTISAGKLSRQNVWFMLEKQFWSRISFGLCAVTATLPELSKCLMKTYYEIQPQGGIRSTARKGTRQLNAGFYGIGCPHPAVECLAAQLNKLIMHYGSKSCLGLNLQTSLELMIIEMGTTLQPLVENYNQCHHWLTPSWLKLIWEKAKSFDITVNFAPLPLEPPQEWDSWIIKIFILMNYDHQELRQLNRVRMHQQVIFLSDVCDSSRRALDKKYLNERPQHDQWFTLSFPKENPSDNDFCLWKEALPQIRALGGRLHLGPYKRAGHKI